MVYLCSMHASHKLPVRSLTRHIGRVLDHHHMAPSTMEPLVLFGRNLNETFPSHHWSSLAVKPKPIMAIRILGSWSEQHGPLSPEIYLLAVSYRTTINARVCVTIQRQCEGRR